MEKLRIGDVVKIRKDLDTHKKYGEEFAAREMVDYAGMTAKIIDIVLSYGYLEYKLDITKQDNWNWTKEMFQEKILNNISFDKYSKGDGYV